MMLQNMHGMMMQGMHQKEMRHQASPQQGMRGMPEMLDRVRQQIQKLEEQKEEACKNYDDNIRFLQEMLNGESSVAPTPVQFKADSSGGNGDDRDDGDYDSDGDRDDDHDDGSDDDDYGSDSNGEGSDDDGLKLDILTNDYQKIIMQELHDWKLLSLVGLKTMNMKPPDEPKSMTFNVKDLVMKRLVEHDDGIGVKCKYQLTSMGKDYVAAQTADTADAEESAQKKLVEEKDAQMAAKLAATDAAAGGGGGGAGAGSADGGGGGASAKPRTYRISKDTPSTIIPWKTSDGNELMWLLTVVTPNGETPVYMRVDDINHRAVPGALTTVVFDHFENGRHEICEDGEYMYVRPGKSRHDITNLNVGDISKRFNEPSTYEINGIHRHRADTVYVGIPGLIGTATTNVGARVGEKREMNIGSFKIHHKTGEYVVNMKEPSVDEPRYDRPTSDEPVQDVMRAKNAITRTEAKRLVTEAAAREQRGKQRRGQVKRDEKEGGRTTLSPKAAEMKLSNLGKKR
jgi:hypothetical protein